MRYLSPKLVSITALLAACSEPPTYEAARSDRVVPLPALTSESADLHESNCFADENASRVAHSLLGAGQIVVVLNNVELGHRIRTTTTNSIGTLEETALVLEYQNLRIVRGQHGAPADFEILMPEHGSRFRSASASADIFGREIDEPENESSPRETRHPFERGHDIIARLAQIAGRWIVVDSAVIRNGLVRVGPDRSVNLNELLVEL